MATLSKEEYWDKVYACWLGKNCGGTLGAPLEKAFTQDEPFNIDWYPELREGGIPNDDLEMQLIWLKAVEEQGFDLTARELAQYWLDYIGYNWDEYGLNKTNLRLGLFPPVSGHFNNWFIDCMGSPIRSELWACLAPGVPDLAVRYAFEDASVDHAGGEGVWGEIFNAAVQSAAFVEQDPQTLLEIGLSYVPPDRGVARAVRAAREAREAGVSWREARARVRAATPHYNAQYTPPNLGFQVIGWLWGQDFGDALCTTVNCGHDTDCTGATLGALLGILHGRAGLPERWTQPLGDTIATNESWGGLRNVSSGPNPVPATLGELTDRVCALGERLLAARGAGLRIGERTNLRERHKGDLAASAAVTDWLREQNPLCVEHRLAAVDVCVDYGETPAIVPGQPKSIAIELRNRRGDRLALDVALTAPEGWSVEPTASQNVALPAHEGTALRYTFSAGRPALVHNSNRTLLSVQPDSRPAEPVVPIVLVGARRWLVWGPQAGEGDGATLLDRAYGPEEGAAPAFEAEAIAEGWRVAPAPGNALPDEIGSNWTGVLYARLYLHSPDTREVRLGIPATCARKLWLNGQPIHEVRQGNLLRPNYGGDGASYVDTALAEGWNEVLVKYARGAGDAPFAAHLTLSSTGLYHGLADVQWTRFPWED